MIDVPKISRRGLLGIATVAPLILLALRDPARAQTAAPCVNPDTLPAGQKGMRRSLGFKVQSLDPKKRCSGCSFFTASSGGCGKCALFSGGPVFATSVCDSWTAKG